MKFIRTILKKVIPASQIKNYMCFTNINHFLLFWKIVTLQSESHALHIYILGKMQRFLTLKKAVCDDLYQIARLMSIIHKVVCLLLNHPMFICSSKICWKNEVRIYNTIVFPILCFGYEDLYVYDGRGNGECI